MLKVWNVSLVLATGILAILGTFLVRSGILESIHAFGASTLGIPFLVLIAVMVAGSIALVVTRAAELRSEHRLDSLLSREAVFLLNNLVLVGLCFVIFWGTFFPLISEAITGTQASVGPPWFGALRGPARARARRCSRGSARCFAWRRATAANLRRELLLPVGAAGVVLVVLLARAAWRDGRGAGDVLPRHVRARGRRAGVLARRARAARDVRRFGAAGAGRAGAPQPAPLRRLHRPRRDRGAVRRGRRLHRVPGRPRRAAGARRARRVGGYEITYVRPDRQHRRRRRTARSRRSTSARSCGCARGERRARDAAHRAQLLPLERSRPRRGVALLRGRGDERGRPDAPACAETSGRSSRPTSRACARSLERGDRGLRAGALSCPPPSARRRSARRCAGWSARYRARRARRRFRVLVSPLVTWIWLGALIVFAGGLIAMWPAPAGARRRLDAPSRASRPGARPRLRRGLATWMEVLLVLVVLACAVCADRRAAAAAARRRGGRRRVARSAPTSRRQRRRSTARSATPSSTTARESSRSEDWRAARRELRAEAIELLRRARRARATAGRAAPRDRGLTRPRLGVRRRSRRAGRHVPPA